MAITIPRAVPLRARARNVINSFSARAQRTSRVARARAGYAAGVATAGAGVSVQFGAGWALMVTGAVTSVSFLVLYPVDEP